MKSYKWTGATEIEVTIAEGAAKGVYVTSSLKFEDGLLSLGYHDISGKHTHLRIRVADTGNLESEINASIAGFEASLNSPEKLAEIQKEIEYLNNMSHAGFDMGLCGRLAAK